MPAQHLSRKGAIMTEKRQSVLASVLLLLVGIWIAVSPVGVVLTGGAAASVIITGIVIALAGLVQLFSESSVPSWVGGLAAVWLFISALAFNLSSGGTWTLIIS